MAGEQGGGGPGLSHVRPGTCSYVLTNGRAGSPRGQPVRSPERAGQPSVPNTSAGSCPDASAQPGQGPELEAGSGGSEAGTLTLQRRGKVKGRRGREGGPDGLLFCKTQNRFQHRASQRQIRAPRGPGLTSPVSGRGSRYDLASSCLKCVTAASGPCQEPISVGFVNFAFLVCYIRYHLTQTMPPGDRPPHPRRGGCSQCLSPSSSRIPAPGEKGRP